MNIIAQEFLKSLPEGRCKNCEFAIVVSTSDGYMFLGCKHPPYRGMRVAEIEDCPKEAVE